MACLSPDGSLSATARRLLQAIGEGADDDVLRDMSDLPLYRLRASLRELAEAGLVRQGEAGPGLTEAGRRALKG